MLLSILSSFPSPSLSMNVLTTLQNSQSNPTPHWSPLFRTPVDYSEQRVSDRFAIDLVNETLRLPTSLGRAHGGLQAENLKHETQAFNVECRNKIEDKIREQSEEVAASTWCGRLVNPNKTSEKLQPTHPLYSGARLENKDVKRRLTVKFSTAGLVRARLTPRVLALLKLQRHSGTRRVAKDQYKC